MIPRTAKRLETVFLSARQALPRPARLYSTPSKRLNNPAAATATIPTPNNDFPPFLPQNASQEASSSQQSTSHLQQFLSGKTPLTVLPTPEPGNDPSPLSERWFVDSRSLDMAGIIDACLHNYHDVDRAHEVFQRLRKKVGSAVLQTSMYNAFLEAYTGVAAKDRKGYWLDEAWKLYEVMESGAEEIMPNYKTYSLMLLIWQRFHSNEEQYNFTSRRPDYLLTNIVKRNIPILDIIRNPVLNDPVEVTAIAQTLAIDAVKLNLPEVLNDLGHAPADAKSPEDHSNSVPEVMPVTSGKTQEVPFSIAGLRHHLGQISETRDLLQNEAYARQQQIETSVYQMAKDHLDHRKDVFEAKGIDGFFVRDNQLKHWMWEWHSRLKVRLEEDQVALKKGKHIFAKKDSDVEAYLLMLKPDTLSMLTILETLRLHGSGGVIGGMKTARACISVGKAVENQHKAQICKRNDIPMSPTAIARNIYSAMGYQDLYQRRTAAAQTASDNEGWAAAWSQSLRARVGSVLLDRMLSVAEVTLEQFDPHTNSTLVESHPAFYQSYEYIRGQKLGVIKLHPAVIDRLAKDSVHQTIHPRHLPMLVMPQPWIDYNRGGYLYSKSYAMRFKESQEQESYVKVATEQGHLEVVFAGLDILGSTPWKINHDIFLAIIEVWNQGNRMGKIPPARYEAPEPVLSEEESKDLQTRSHHIIRHRAWAQANANNHSDRCSVNYKLEIARAFLHDTFYLPHNLDFRGRAYPIPPHLNHMGDDISRSLLLFANAKPLGERGLRWLKIHTANLFGYDKARFDERVEWVEEHMDEIKESAEHPLDGTGWWRNADDPWQFLSACKELKKAYECEDPTMYECALPVHQDGTCNGLQHYAALGGDTKGAEQVNLAAADKPSDVYTFISLQVQAAIDKEAAETKLPIAIKLKDKITRKIVKQTVMTTVYGVTFIGAREQIEKQLRDRSGLPKEECWAASSYVAKKLLATIGDTFRGAKSIQDWLNLCARLISKSIPGSRLGAMNDDDGKSVVTIKKGDVKKEQMTSVIWTTVLGLPIVQPYRKVKRRQINTALQSVYISDPHRSEEVNTQKQASAFPPNFIHSLDATHMLLTAIDCHKRGLTFASIHDSYWTHACDIDSMSEAIRETFIELHLSDVLSKLEREFRTRYADHHVLINDLASAGKAGLLVERLAKAGTRVYTKTDMSDLPIIGPLTEVTDDEDRLAVLSTKKRRSDSDSSEDAEIEVDDATRARPEFVRLIDLFPPLPEKGDFEVSSIKSSPYFFS